MNKDLDFQINKDIQKSFSLDCTSNHVRNFQHPTVYALNLFKEVIQKKRNN